MDKTACLNEINKNFRLIGHNDHKKHDFGQGSFLQAGIFGQTAMLWQHNKQ